jgi:hypothetical protein
MRAEAHFDIENKLVNLLLDMEEISVEQLEEMVTRLGDAGMDEIIKLLAKMALVERGR